MPSHDQAPAGASPGFLVRFAKAFIAASSTPPAPAAEQKIASGVHFTGPVWRNNRLSWLNPSGVNINAEHLDSLTAFATSAYCFKAMEYRAQKLAEAKPIVVRVTKEGEEWLPGHPLSGLLAEPRPDVNMPELVQRTSLYRDGTGAALWKLERTNLETVAMVTPFSKREFRTKSQQPLIYGQYEILVENPSGGETWRAVKREDVVHFRDINPHSWHEPVSRVDVALAQLNLGHTINRIVRTFLDRAMFPGGVISPAPTWQPTKPEWELYKELIDEWYGGPANAGNPLVVPGGTVFTRSGASVKDLLPSELLDRIETIVASVFGIAPVVLGWLVGLQNSPWSQMEEARRQTYQDTLEPLWLEMADTITARLISPEDRARGILVRFDTTTIRALQPDMERRSRESVLNASTWTLGERRLHTGKELLGDERDDIIEGLIPPPVPEFVGDGSAGDEDDELDEDGKAAADSIDLRWLIFETSTKAAEPPWTRVIATHLAELRTDVTRLAQRTLRAQKAAADAGEQKTEPVDPRSAEDLQLALQELLDKSNPRLVARTYPLLVSQGGTAVRRLSARLGLSFRVLEPGLLKFAREESQFLASVMGESTGTAVAEAVQKGLAEGDTIAQLIRRLEQLPDFDRQRARLVARTETTRAWNGAQRRSMSEFRRSSGRRVEKTWVSSRDDRVREEHAELDGTTLSVDQAFDNGLMEPGEPNCRCTLVYSVAAAAGAGQDDEIAE